MNWIKEELRKIDHSVTALRRFGYTVGTVFLFGGFLLLAQHRALGAPLTFIGAAVIIVACATPKLLGRFHIAWMAISLIVGFVMTSVILSAVFFLVVAPIGLLQRIFRKSPIDLAFGDGSRSYWEPKATAGTPADYERQF